MAGRGGPSSTLRQDDGPITVVRAGRVDYRRAWAWQRELVAARTAGTIGDVLVLVEHPPTYTLGSRGDEGNVLLDHDQRGAAEIELVRTDRGGDVTYHGPGQVVGYPIVRLSGPRVVDYVRALEELNLRMLADHGVSARRIDGLTGVWTDRGKITAIGVRVTAGRVTQHGWATNVDPDLDHFGGIVPCGIDDRPVTSMRALGVGATRDEVAEHSATALAEVFAADLATSDPDDLAAPLSAVPAAPRSSVAATTAAPGP